jgi:hypothetical protein
MTNAKFQMINFIDIIRRLQRILME